MKFKDKQLNVIYFMLITHVIIVELMILAKLIMFVKLS